MVTCSPHSKTPLHLTIQNKVTSPINTVTIRTRHIDHQENITHKRKEIKAAKADANPYLKSHKQQDLKEMQGRTRQDTMFAIA